MERAKHLRDKPNDIKIDKRDRVDKMDKLKIAACPPQNPPIPITTTTWDKRDKKYIEI